MEEAGERGIVRPNWALPKRDLPWPHRKTHGKCMVIIS